MTQDRKLNRIAKQSDDASIHEEYGVTANTEPAQPRLTAEELNKKLLDWLDAYAFRVPYDGSNSFYDENIIKVGKDLINGVLAECKQFSRQEVEAKDREWRERFQKRIDELRKQYVVNGYIPNRIWERITELENLLKQED